MALTLASWTDCTKIVDSCSGLQLAKQLDSQKDVARLFIVEIVDLISGLHTSHKSDFHARIVEIGCSEHIVTLQHHCSCCLHNHAVPATLSLTIL